MSGMSRGEFLAMAGLLAAGRGSGRRASQSSTAGGPSGPIGSC
jgi:hypothetical protein